MGVVLIVWGMLTFAWLGYARPIDELGVCGPGHPAVVAAVGYRRSIDLDAVTRDVQVRCRAQARRLTLEALFPTIALLGAGLWLVIQADRWALKPLAPRPLPDPPTPRVPLERPGRRQEWDGTRWVDPT